MDLGRKKILVTGADGFIGSHLVEKLINLCSNVKAFVYYNSFNSYGWLDTFEIKKRKQIEIFSGDVRDPNGVRNAVRNCDIVIHLAALIAIPFSYHSPDSYVDTNIKGTLNILNACRDFDIEKIVITSTSEVYGTAQYVPIDEDHFLQGQSPYAATKIAADQLTLSFHKSFNLPVSIIRPFNTYGPRQSARAIIPTIIIQILSGKGKIMLGNLSPTRDFTYITDTVEGFVKMVISEKCIGEVINIGNNFEISMYDLVKKIAFLLESDITILAEESRRRPKKSEVERLICDNSKAIKLLNWTPKFDLDKGLRKTIKWFCDQNNLSRYKSDIYNV